MPVIESAKKSLRQNKKRKKENKEFKKRMKESIKEIRDLVEEENLEEAEKKLSTTYKAIDKAAKNGVIKDNTAARKKSRLVAALKRAS